MTSVVPRWYGIGVSLVAAPIETGVVTAFADGAPATRHVGFSAGNFRTTDGTGGLGVSIAIWFSTSRLLLYRAASSTSL